MDDILAYFAFLVPPSGVTAVIGAIIGRMAMGTILDVAGPRVGSAGVMLLFAPPVFLMALVSSAGGFQCVRFFIGIALCCFVCCQQWVGSMFNVKIVGTANAISAGWGNLGGGLTHLIMPAIYESIERGGVPSFTAWRYAFWVPGGIYIFMGVVTMMFGQDAPTGDYRDLKKSGEMATGKGSLMNLLKCALTNYRTYVLAFNYGYSFGVELTVDNIIVTYLYDTFQMDLVTGENDAGLYCMAIQTSADMNASCTNS